jgi:hypothetical protein
VARLAAAMLPDSRVPRLWLWLWLWLVDDHEGTMITGAFSLPLTTPGMMDASTTRRLLTPCSRMWGFAAQEARVASVPGARRQLGHAYTE